MIIQWACLLATCYFLFSLVGRTRWSLLCYLVETAETLSTRRWPGSHWSSTRRQKRTVPFIQLLVSSTSLKTQWSAEGMHFQAAKYLSPSSCPSTVFLFLSLSGLENDLRGSFLFKHDFDAIKSMCILACGPVTRCFSLLGALYPIIPRDTDLM